MSATIQQLADLQSNIDFAKSLMAEFKQQNKDDGINALQAMWLHHRVRAWSYSFYGISYTVDIPNMVISGDIETACLALLNGAPDDMSQAYHWVSAPRVAWLTDQMKSFLGWA